MQHIDSTFAARPAGGGDRADVVKVGTLRGQPTCFTRSSTNASLPRHCGRCGRVRQLARHQERPGQWSHRLRRRGRSRLPGRFGCGTGCSTRRVGGRRGHGIVAAPGIESVDDLRGRRSDSRSVPRSEILLRLPLARLGLDPGRDVQLVNLPFSDMRKPSPRARFSAFASAELGPATAIEAGAPQSRLAVRHPVGRVNIGLATTQRTIDANPNWCRRSSTPTSGRPSSWTPIATRGTAVWSRSSA